MQLTEKRTIDGVTVRETGHLEVRRALRIFRDGEEISKTYHRHVLAPGDDLSNEDPKVIAIAQAAWTLDVIEDHALRVAKQAALSPPPTESPTE